MPLLDLPLHPHPNRRDCRHSWDIVPRLPPQTAEVLGQQAAGNAVQPQRRPEPVGGARRDDHGAESEQEDRDLLRGREPDQRALLGHQAVRGSAAEVLSGTPEHDGAGGGAGRPEGERDDPYRGGADGAE